MFPIRIEFHPVWGCSRFHRRIRTGHLILRNLILLSPKIDPKRCYTFQGYPFDLYEPSRPLHRTLLMVYGFTFAGEKEPRLIRFVKAFTAAGFRVVVPDLPGLKSLDLQKGDLERLIDLMAFLHHEFEGSVGVVGFSVGGGIAITAAVNPSLQGFANPILLFGPHYSLSDLWSGLWRNKKSFPKTKEAWDDFIWWQLMLAYRQRKALGFNAADQFELVELLRTYCSKPSLGNKRKAYERLVQPHGLLDTQGEVVDLDVLECLSPRGKLGKLPAKVLLLHDSFDPLIPPSQSQDMLTELQQRAIPHQERLVITPLLAHVSPRAVLNLPDLMAILDMIGELFTRSNEV
jgi:pimeloyl-ACP methyl ester carboxylesterase